MNVPYLDLTRARLRIAAELSRRWEKILEQNAYVLGPEVKDFEAAFAAYLEVPKAIGVANGTDALVLALRALDMQPGDEVIVPAFTFFATAEAVVLLGGVPVFCDIDPETLNMDPADVAARVTGKTVGILGVHLYGRPFDVDAVQEVCRRHGLWLLEDAAQAQGALYRGKRVGGLGQLAAWSFYPTKNLGCYGDGGAVSGPDADLVQKVFLLANHGQTARYHHVLVGTNSRLDSLQAAVLNCRLPLLDEDNARRRALACRYHGELADLIAAGEITLPPDREGIVSVYHQMTIGTKRRDELMKHLTEKGIASSIHYPSPLHLQPALAGSGTPPELPITEQAAKEVLCLPMFPELTNEEVEQVGAAVRGFFAG